MAISKLSTIDSILHTITIGPIPHGNYLFKQQNPYMGIAYCRSEQFSKKLNFNQNHNVTQWTHRNSYSNRYYKVGV